MAQESNMYIHSQTVTVEPFKVLKLKRVQCLTHATVIDADTSLATKYLQGIHYSSFPSKTGLGQ